MSDAGRIERSVMVVAISIAVGFSSLIAMFGGSMVYVMGPLAIPALAMLADLVLEDDSGEESDADALAQEAEP